MECEARVEVGPSPVVVSSVHCRRAKLNRQS